MSVKQKEGRKMENKHLGWFKVLLQQQRTNALSLSKMLINKLGFIFERCKDDR